MTADTQLHITDLIRSHYILSLHTRINKSIMLKISATILTCIYTCHASIQPYMRMYVHTYSYNYTYIHRLHTRSNLITSTKYHAMDIQTYMHK